MSEFSEQIAAAVLQGSRIDRATALQLAAVPDQEAIWQNADRIRQHYHGSHLSLCAIINARSGRCSEDCRFCAQSARYRSRITEYEIISHAEALRLASESDRHGVHRLSLVSSGRGLDDLLLERLVELYAQIRATTLLKLCGSLGLLTRDRARRLREMGVSRYHCNLEASRGFFARVCTTHTWEEKVETLQLAREEGLSLCSGGIIGMGETLADRIDLALELRDLEVDSIPLNILTPIPGTPLADLRPPGIEEVLTTIALFRFINPRVIIRIAGGRQQLGEDQYRCFTAGANGAMVGNYLTTCGSAIADDLRNFTALGFTFA